MGRVVGKIFKETAIKPAQAEDDKKLEDKKAKNKKPEQK